MRAARARGPRGTQGKARRGPGAPAALPRGLTHQLMVPNLALPLGFSTAARSSGITSGFARSPGSDVTPPALPGSGG